MPTSFIIIPLPATDTPNSARRWSILAESQFPATAKTGTFADWARRTIFSTSAGVPKLVKIAAKQDAVYRAGKI